jgi:hypothetical protein
MKKNTANVVTASQIETIRNELMHATRLNAQKLAALIQLCGPTKGGNSFPMSQEQRDGIKALSKGLLAEEQIEFLWTRDNEKRKKLEEIIDRTARNITILHRDSIRKRFIVSHVSKTRAPNPNFFTLIELFSFILPQKIRSNIFEPAYNDEKADYLDARHRYQSSFAGLWLSFWFSAHVVLMVAQCICGMCSERIKRAVLNVLPDVFRKLGGG